MNYMNMEKLGKYCKIISGYAFKSNDLSEGTEIPVIKIGNISNGNDVIIDSSTQYVSSDFLSIDEKYHIKKGDVLISLTGSHINQPNSMVGRSCRNFSDTEFLLNQRAGKVIPNENADKNYLYYLLNTESFKYSICNRAYGAANQANVSPSDIDNIKWNFPPLPTQQKIASILSAYDNLIQNYKKQIEALQTAASELYKEWFVRFRFPGWQNAKFENGIPEGWKVERIGALYDSTSGGTPSREHEEYFQNGTYPWIKTGELKDSPILETEESITDEAIKHSSAKLFEKDSLIIAMYGATIGQLGINKMKATCNQACCVLRPKKDKAFGIYYLFHFFKENREFIIGLGNGAAQQNLSQVLINKLKIVNPNKEIFEIFEEKESMFFEKIYSLQQQITNLTQQRDLLLPRLMSGKLEVK